MVLCCLSSVHVRLVLLMSQMPIYESLHVFSSDGIRRVKSDPVIRFTIGKPAMRFYPVITQLRAHTEIVVTIDQIDFDPAWF